jgi:hypothetical protein
MHEVNPMHEAVFDDVPAFTILAEGQLDLLKREKGTRC